MSIGLLYWSLWLTVLLCGAFVFIRWHSTPDALPPSLTAGWWLYADQGRYLAAAQALAQGDFSAARQWYEPGYALLAVPFIWFPQISQHDPFLIPDLACYLLSGVLTGMLGRRLLAAGRWGGLLGTLAFVAATIWSSAAMAIWGMPWTTTPVTVLILATLAATLALTERPRPAPCFAAALGAGAIALFRPSDTVIVAVPAALAVAAALLRHRAGARAMAAIAAAGLAGAAISLGAALALHVAIWGWTPGRYLTESAGIGFAPALIPFRWVLLFIGPRPMLTEGIGMAALFPWIIPGAAGMAVSLIAPGRTGGQTGRTPHAIVIGAAVLQCLMLLAYRDLHPTGLWRYFNYHYFKWLIPLFALYALVLLRALLDRDRRLRVLATAAVTAVALFCWRPSLSPAPGGLQADQTGPHQLTLRTGTRQLGDAILAAASGPRDAILMSDYGGAGPGRYYTSNADYKAYPRPGGLLLVPLRPLPAGLRIDLPPSVTLDGPPMGVRQHAVFGLPCWTGPCPTPLPLPPPQLPLGATLVMDAAADNTVSGSWELAEPGGRWLQGPDGAITIRLAWGQPGQRLVLQLRGATDNPPPGAHGLRIMVTANGHPLALWQPPYGAVADLAAAIPAAAAAPDGTLSIGFHVEGRPYPDFKGEAILGGRTIFMNTIRIEAAAPP